jgi:hypothetical protein
LKMILNLGQAFLKACGFGQSPKNFSLLQIIRRKQLAVCVLKTKFEKTGDSH